MLSFAQFEREVTSERIRDKIAASKRKGLWVGGVVPLGYQAKDRKITVVADEAKTVRHIFRRYLDLGSLNLLLTDLRRTGVKTKLRPLSNGRTIGGIPFTRGSLAAFLRNRFYIGEVRYKGEVFPGEQSAILDRALFDAVQSKLDRQRTNHAKARQQSQSLLMGRIFDDARQPDDTFVCCQECRPLSLLYLSSPYSGAAGQGRQAQPRARHRNRKADPQRGPQTSRREPAQQNGSRGLSLTQRQGTHLHPYRPR